MVFLPFFFFCEVVIFSRVFSGFPTASFFCEVRMFFVFSKVFYGFPTFFFLLRGGDFF